MAASPCIQCRVDPKTKSELRTLAARQGLTESALLNRLVEMMLKTANAATATTVAVEISASRDSRLTIRLAADDQRLLRERALGRGMPAATYISVLVRSHLRSVARLPNEERLALKKSVAHLAAIRRYLNAIARAYDHGRQPAGPTREEFCTILKVCETFHGHLKGVLKANAESWQVGA
jgi:predicted DNA binding CopG/RHH family protein